MAQKELLREIAQQKHFANKPQMFALGKKLRRFIVPRFSPSWSSTYRITEALMRSKAHMPNSVAN